MKQEILNMGYVIGRRGSLAYLEGSVTQDVGLSGEQKLTDPAFVFGEILRPMLERNLDIAWNIIVMSSLTGDSLLSFAY